VINFGGAKLWQICLYRNFGGLNFGNMSIDSISSMFVGYMLSTTVATLALAHSMAEDETFSF